MFLVVPGFVPVVPGPGFGRVMARFLGAASCPSLSLALSPLSLALALVALWPDFLGPKVVSRCPWLCPRCPWPWLWSRYGQISWGRELCLVVPGFVPVVPGPGFGRVMARFLGAASCPSLSLALSPLSLALALVALWPDFWGRKLFQSQGQRGTTRGPKKSGHNATKAGARDNGDIARDNEGQLAAPRNLAITRPKPGPGTTGTKPGTTRNNFSALRNVAITRPKPGPGTTGTNQGQRGTTRGPKKSGHNATKARARDNGDKAGDNEKQLSAPRKSGKPGQRGQSQGQRGTTRGPKKSGHNATKARARENADKARDNEKQLSAPRNLAITRPKPRPGTTGTKPGTTRNNFRPQEIWP